jgi:hypothetical protein
MEAHDMKICEKIVRGIGLILVANGTGRIYTIRELVAKPMIGKEAGMISFPLETIERGETCCDTIRRMVDEEITGCSFEQISGLFISPNLLMLVPGVCAHVAWGYCDREFTSVPRDPEVVHYGWCSCADLISQKSFVRIETRPSLEIFLDEEK